MLGHVKKNFEKASLDFISVVGIVNENGKHVY
jgi:hypothetical protein